MRRLTALFVMLFAATFYAQTSNPSTPAPAVTQAPVSSRATPPPAEPQKPLPEAVTYCLDCHSDKDQTLTFKDGTTMSLYVDPAELQHSVHSKQLLCTDCHVKYENDHPTGAELPGRREYTVKSYELCKKCHFDTYTRTLESVHYELIKEGIDSAPICVDCHEDVYKTYAASVHGRVLVEDGNLDVPACTDCHTHHQVQQPGTNKFRLNAPDTCIRCHGNEVLMKKYNISTMVAQSYLSDFHGVTASLSRNLAEDKQQIVVTCNDCHGVHNIASPKQKGPDVMRATVTAACQKCHKDSAATFPSAWLSHYPPSPKHAPIVWGVQMFYSFFIPFGVIGLVLHLLLHVYRMSSGR